MEEKGNMGFIQLDLESFKTIGEIQEDNFNNQISFKIAQSIQKLFNELPDWVKEFRSLIKDEKHLDAFELFNKNKDRLSLYKKGILDDLLLLNRTFLTKDKRKEYTLFLIVSASKEDKIGKVEVEIDEFISEFGDDLEPELEPCIFLSKASAAAKNNKMNVANSYFKKIITNNKISSFYQAFANQGLAKISLYQEEIIFYQKQAIDKFLESGNKKEAIKGLVYLSSLFEKESPNDALGFIDKAIALYEGKSSLDKEYMASLYHRKAGYLYSLSKYNAALDSAEKACNLRDNLIGNEHEKHASNFLAKSICDILKDDNKSSFYSNKLEEIAPQIQSDEFNLQTRIEENMSRKEKIDKDLLIQIENSNFSNFKLSTYLFSAGLKECSLDEKLEWLDRAHFLLKNDAFTNHHHAIFYFTLAEVYRGHNQIDEAVKNYELSLECNPFYRLSIQNCGAVLWKNNMWERSKTFFEKQLRKIGETPILCYAYGRSLFELGEYSTAFPYFRKANGKVKGADISHYINLCLEKADDLRLESTNSLSTNYEPPISLDSFKETLEDFARTISTNSRMHFWKNENGKYNWVSCPEEKGKQLLITALNMRYKKESIEIISERVAGAGIIDIYILLRGGLKIVVELKICGGSGYSSTYALTGEDQLLHYLKNTDTCVGFLIVFDGRTRDFSKGFQPLQSIENATIYTIPIEMNPKIIKKE